ncbi:MAG TPA: glycosyl hydrolase, partial [Gemmatimonadales bacterium]|nr:glycosyl hydrolase [Gemmatimonadales bacterium]
AIGLTDGGQIPKIIVSPTDPDVAYAAVLGHIFGPNPERGVFRTTDGGKTWKRILFRNDSSGATDIVMDPTNPRILYAALWQVERMPWGFTSGGAGSGLFKSTDGGDTWTEITRNKGMPDGVIGKIGIAVSANSERLWALVEAKDGGIYRSEDAGNTWKKVNDDHRFRQRAWYFSGIYADPKNPDEVYVQNTGFYRSLDGGTTFESVRVPHGDNHALWIDPNDPNRMIESNDGGAFVTFDGGASWTASDNQPTAQFYHAFVTADFPYRVCGAQQDNSTICVPSRTRSFGIAPSTYQIVAGGESGYLVVRPDSTNISYGGSYGGAIDKHDLLNDQDREVDVWPDNPMGHAAGEITYRFQWTFPIVLSPENPSVLYVASQYVHKSTDGGQSWTTISPDLTRNDSTKLVSSGGPITKDNTSIEYYGTIFTLAPSPLDSNVIWAGSDDGLIHVTQNGGGTWTDVTPKDLPAWSRISIIEASPHRVGTAYVAANRFQLDDDAPYIYKTSDFGKHWTKIVNGIPAGDFIRTVREDSVRAGLLFAGSEYGVFVSFDDGAHWQSLQLNLPIVPVRDLVVTRHDLVAATHGRSFWVLDDIAPLRQLTPEVAKAGRHIFQPEDAVRMDGGGGFGRGFPGMASNPPNGAIVRFWFQEKPTGKVTLDFLTSGDSVIRTFSTTAKRRNEKLDVDAGMNQFVWNLRYPDAHSFPGIIMWSGRGTGPKAVPGTYKVRITNGNWTETRSFQVVEDPAVHVTQADLEQQFRFLIQIRDRLSQANDAVTAIRGIRDQVNAVSKRIASLGDAAPAGAADSVKAAADTLDAHLTAVEREIYQVHNKSGEDPLNFPIKLNDKIAGVASVVGSADAKPTDQSYAVFKDLSAKLQVQLDRLHAIEANEIPAFNTLVGKYAIPAVVVKK